MYMVVTIVFRVEDYVNVGRIFVKVERTFPLHDHSKSSQNALTLRDERQKKHFLQHSKYEDVKSSLLVKDSVSRLQQTKTKKQNNTKFSGTKSFLIPIPLLICHFHIFLLPNLIWNHFIHFYTSKYFYEERLLRSTFCYSFTIIIHLSYRYCFHFMQ